MFKKPSISRIFTDKSLGKVVVIKKYKKTLRTGLGKYFSWLIGKYKAGKTVNVEVVRISRKWYQTNKKKSKLNSSKTHSKLIEETVKFAEDGFSTLWFKIQGQSLYNDSKPINYGEVILRKPKDIRLIKLLSKSNIR